jgi:hypothetical protein
MKLTDSLDDQNTLENIIDETKPPIPPGCEALHFLLMTPFRYSTSNPWGSRFRRSKFARWRFLCLGTSEYGRRRNGFSSPAVLR